MFITVGLMIRLDTATLDYRQAVAELTLEGFKVAYIRIQDKVCALKEISILVIRKCILLMVLSIEQHSCRMIQHLKLLV